MVKPSGADRRTNADRSRSAGRSARDTGAGLHGAPPGLGFVLPSCRRSAGGESEVTPPTTCRQVVGKFLTAPQAAAQTARTSGNGHVPGLCEYFAMRVGTLARC